MHPSRPLLILFAFPLPLAVALWRSAVASAADVTPSASTSPTAAQTVSPGYPATLAGTGRSGAAIIDALVRADGTVADPRVKSADNEAFGSAAAAAIVQWRFTPATRDGRSVDRRVVVPFQFVAPLADVINTRLKRRVFRTIDAPVLSLAEYGARLKTKQPPTPAYPISANGAKQEVEVRFVVAPDGKTLNPEIVGEPRREFVAPALLAVAQASYEPPRKDGQSVYVAASVTLSFAPPRARRGPGFGEFGGNGGSGQPDS